VLKRRSWRWKVTLFLAAIGIGAFVIFDVLDLDASQLRAQSAEGALTETCSADTGRLCTAQPVPHALGASLLPPFPSTASEAPRLSAILRRSHAPRSTALPRARLTLAAASGSRSATDPV
jgi:hypothetical protein